MAEDTIIPRLKKYEANLNNIYCPEDWNNEKFIPYSFSDNRLEILFNQFTPELVIFDPLTYYLGFDLDMNRANQVRPTLSKLQNLAQRHNTAIVIVAHQNKMIQQGAYNRLSESVDFMAAVRSALFLGQHQQLSDVKILFNIKNNLAERGSNICYAFNNGVLVPDDSIDVSNFNADDCTKQAKNGQTRADTQKSLAKTLIEAAFVGRDKIPVSELKELAKNNNFNWDTFRLSKPENVKTISKGFNPKVYYWSITL